MSLTKEQKIMIVLSIVGIAMVVGMAILIVKYSNSGYFTILPQGQIVVIRFYGEISYSNGLGVLGLGVNANQLIQLLNRLDKDPNVKAIILDINSPGGDAVASELIAERIHSMHKPVIAVCESVCASGAYMVASACKKIYVQPDTITASIGAYIDYVNKTDYYKNKSIIYEPIKRNKYKDILAPYRPMTKEERAWLYQIVNQTYEHFVHMVEEYRHINFSKLPYMIRESAFCNGQEAVKYHLADGIEPLWKVEEMVNKKYCNGNCKIVYMNAGGSLFPL